MGRTNTAVAAAVGASLRLAGRDTTAESMHRSCLVLAPHPDDEVLGCAVTVMRKRQAGTPVWVLIATDGRGSDLHVPPAELAAVRGAELSRAGDILGLDPSAVTHLSFEDGKLEADDELVAALTDELRRRRPDDVLVTSASDAHPDHAALGAAAQRAVARHQSEGAIVRILTFPVWQWEYWPTWAGTILLASRPELVSTSGYLSRKGQAIAVYGSQLHPEAGGENPDGLSAAFVGRFLQPYEVFFPVGPHDPTTGVGPRLLRGIRRLKRRGA
jgi:LmbE family N-acetylglucosaminyl deacetylase